MCQLILRDLLLTVSQDQSSTLDVENGNIDDFHLDVNGEMYEDNAGQITSTVQSNIVMNCETSSVKSNSLKSLNRFKTGFLAKVHSVFHRISRIRN